MPERLPVRKTYKLYINGQFPRSESGRTYIVNDAKGRLMANAAQASRKDARDAVVAARAAFGGWSGRTAYNRAQIVYRIAEVLEGRREQFEAELRASEGVSAARARTYLDAAVDRLVWYAGWADKLAQVLGGANPVAGPYFNFTVPEPTGVVAVIAPEEPALAGLVSRIMPVIVGGNAVVAVVSEQQPSAAIELAEAIATSDLPGGVVNLLTGFRDELAPVLAGHMDVNAIDVTGAEGSTSELERLAADNVKRVVHGTADEQSPWVIASFLELKTVWHPVGQ